MLLLVEDLATKFSSISELVELLCPPPLPSTTTISITTTTTTTAKTKVALCSNTSTTSIFSIPQELIQDKIIIAYLTVQPVNHENVIVRCASSHDGAYPLYKTLIDDNNQSWWLSADQTMINGKGHEYVQYNLLGKQQQQQVSISNNNYKNNNSTTPATTTNCPDNSTIIDDNSNDNDTNTTVTTKDKQPEDDENEQNRSVCRLQKISLKIPPLPMGPLSVGYFHLERVSYYSTNDSTTTTNKATNNINHSKGNNSNVWTKCTKSFRVDGSTSNWQEFIVDTPIDVHTIRFVCTCNQISLVSSCEENIPDYYYSVGFFCIRFD